MEDPTQNSNVINIQPLSDPADDQNQSPKQRPSGGSFGKPGLASGGEGSGNWESDPVVHEEARGSPEVYKAPEALITPEIGEKEKPQEAPKPNQKEEDSPRDTVQKISITEKIVDNRTGKEKTHRVDINRADSATKIADIKEQEFIEGVEKVHSLV